MVTNGVYVISVAARLLHMHPQTLRKYERVGVVIPSRTIGMLRLYSVEDIVQLKLHLVRFRSHRVQFLDFFLSSARNYFAPRPPFFRNCTSDGGNFIMHRQKNQCH